MIVSTDTNFTGTLRSTLVGLFKVSQSNPNTYFPAWGEINSGVKSAEAQLVLVTDGATKKLVTAFEFYAELTGAFNTLVPSSCNVYCIIDGLSGLAFSNGTSILHYYNLSALINVKGTWTNPDDSVVYPINISGLQLFHTMSNYVSADPNWDVDTVTQTEAASVMTGGDERMLRDLMHNFRESLVR